jgi:DNA-binding CsgD family transcriptional regulator/PAS domain-containing protein
MKSELVELSDVIGDIYDAAIDPTLWPAALGSICAYVGGSSAVLFWHDAATEHSEALHLFNEDPTYTRLYFEKYLPMNPMFPAATFVDLGVVVADEDIMPASELVKTRFYKEWIKPQGITGALAVNLEKGTTRTSLINIRLSTSTTQEMRSRLGVLVPHLQRATAISKLFDQNKATEKLFANTLNHVEAAVFLVSANAGIVFANEAAERMLAQGALVKKQSNALRAVAPEANRILVDIFSAAEEGDESVGIRGIAVPLTDALDERWFAHVLPLTSGRRRQAGDNYAAVAAVFIRKTAPNALSPLEGFAKLYKLTAGEVRVFDAVLKVNGVKAIAELLGLSQATVKTHLQSLFRKTATGRQSELIKLAAGL